MTDHLLHGQEAVRPAFHDLDIVVRESDQAEADGQDQDREGLGMAPEGQQAPDGHAEQDHQTAHVGGPALFQVAFGSVTPFCLSGLEPSQKGDQESAGDSAHGKGGQKRDDCRCQVYVKMHD